MYGFVDTVPGSGTGSTSLMSIRTIFNGIDLDQELTDETGSFTTLTVNGRNDTRSTINSFSVPGMDGAHEEGNTLDAKTINVRFRITDKTNEGFRERLNRLNALLSGSKQVLEFTDEDAVFYATVSSVEMPDEESNDLIGNIFFYCSDPYKYGPELEATFPSDAVTVTNNGTAPAKPVFELEVNESTTFAMVSNGDEYMMIGEPIDVTEDIPFQKYERVFYTDASSLVGWTDGTYVDGGVVAGQMASNGTRFQASSYGTGNAWHGPAIKQSLPEVLTDFRMESFISFYNGNLPMYVGRIEIYLLDANEQVVGKIAIKDTQNGQALTVGEVRAGSGSNSHFLINESGDRPGNWNNFSGQVRIERDGNVWRAYIAMVDTATGRHHTRRAATWIDSENRLTRTVAQVQIHIGQYRTHQTPAGGVYSLSVYKINQQEEGTPYIANEGDVITFDHNQNLILINGEPRKDLKNFGADYFKLQPGNNNIVVLPEGTFSTRIRYREPFK